MCCDSHILEINSVELSFGERQILTNVYLRVDTGKVTAILGFNGSGKSCLMRILFGELRPTYKSMRIDSVWNNSFSNEQVLYLPQRCSLPKGLKIETIFNDFNVSFDDFLNVFPELEILKGKKVSEMSGGEKRIIEIFVLLRAKSQFIMLDEPFSQVMPLHVERIKEIINQAKQHKGILLTDHMYRNVIDIADNLYVISNQTVYLTKDMSDLQKYGYINHIL